MCHPQLPEGLTKDKVPMIEKTSTDITVPKFKPELPVPQGGNVLVQVPIGGVSKKPDMTVDIAYTEKVTGGVQVLPNPALAAAKVLGNVVGNVGLSCPEMCCTGEVQEVTVCMDQPFRWETVEPKVRCPSGCPANSKGKCVCEKAKVAACPSHKPLTCNLNGTNFCVNKDWGCSAWGTRCNKEKEWKSC